MKKFFVLGLGLGAVLSMTSCKSSESAYKKAYEKAKQQQAVATEQESTQTQTTTQVEVTPVTPAETSSADVNSVQVQSEKVTVVAGDGLKAYSVVCGSFSLKAKAEGLQKTLTNAGYNAQIAYHADKNMYRVVASTYDDKAAAVQSRNVLRTTYSDAWLLYSK
ncbi:MAG: SPOR domain-containing protein [Paraprevotella sp.]|nr:SPOR domain-containing protein [Paraprevotella sp.]